jgi:hypothetical protein
MAKGRIRSRMELREQYDAAEAREREERGTGKAEGDDADDDAETEVAEVEEGDEEAAPVKKKKKAPAKEPKPRKKAVKLVRRRIVWVVYDNSNKKIAQFDYPKKSEADELVEKLKTEKKQTYFVQPVKEEIAE